MKHGDACAKAKRPSGRVSVMGTFVSSCAGRGFKHVDSGKHFERASFFTGLNLIFLSLASHFSSLYTPEVVSSGPRLDVKQKESFHGWGKL